MNAETCEGVPLHRYDFVLADPPYSKEDAQHYGTKLPASRKVMATLAAGLPAGAWFVCLDRRRPMYRKENWRYEAAIGIEGSTNHQCRMLRVFRRI